MTMERLRILAIDDMPANLLMLGAALEREYEVQFATSGPAGVALALKSAPDLILLDVMMPEVDGFETFKRLTAEPKLRDIPVIFVTALGDECSELTGLTLGAADYITKPINVMIARQRIHNQVERERLRKEVERQRIRLGEEIELRRKSEDQLRKLSIAVEQSPASVAITDLDACIEYVNPRFTEVTGYAPSEVLGKNPRFLQSGLTTKETHLQLWDALTRGMVWKGEFVNKRKNGEVYWEDSQIAPICDAAGKVTHYVAVKSDITRRKLAEQSLLSLAAQQKAMLDNDLVGIVKVCDRKILWANPAFERMLGYATQELVGTPTRNNYPSEESYLAFGQACYPAIAAGGVFRTQAEHVRKDGTLIHVDVSGSMLDKMSGESLWSFIDISEQTEAREALTETARVLRSAQRLGHIGDWSWDLRSGLHTWSDEIFSIYGCDPVLGPVSYPEIMKHFTEESAIVLGKAVNECRTHGTSYQCDAEVVRPDGTTRWITVLGEATTDTDGTVVLMLGTVQDITQRKEMERQVQQLAFHDPLTNLPNRRLLKDRISQAMAATKRSGRYAALMFMDLDNFKPLNDDHGHDVGDLLLVEVATRLESCVREIDTVARFGGDEFVVMLSDLTTDLEESVAQATAVAEKIRLLLASPYQFIIEHTGEPSVQVTHLCTASIGVTLFLNHNASEDDILKRADAAMYLAKDAGRNTIRFYEEPVP